MRTGSGGNVGSMVGVRTPSEPANELTKSQGGRGGRQSTYGPPGLPRRGSAFVKRSHFPVIRPEDGFLDRLARFIVQWVGNILIVAVGDFPTWHGDELGAVLAINDPEELVHNKLVVNRDRGERLSRPSPLTAPILHP